MKQTTLCYLLKDREVLLAMKKRGFGEGRWNGCGGKLFRETHEQAAIRELEEEIGVKVKQSDLTNMGHLVFYFPHKSEWDHDVIIFTIHKWSGEPVETEEMRPQWFSFDQIPYDDMWPDDKFWMPKMLDGKRIEGQFWFGKDGKTIEKFDLKEI